MILYFLGIVLFLVFVHLVCNYNAHARSIRRIPGLKDRFIVGNAIELLLSPVELFKLPRKYAQKYERIFRYWSFPFGAVAIYEPSDVEKVLSSIKHNDKGLLYKILKPWLQDGLLLSNGAKWQHRRKILTPAFHFNILKQFSVTLDENSRRMAETLEAANGKQIDVVPLISELMLHSICETSMGTQLSDGKSTAATEYKNAIYELGKMFVERFTKTIYLIDFVFALSTIGKRQLKYLNTVHTFTKRVIQDRKEYVERFGIDINEGNIDKEDTFYYGKRKTAMLDLLLSAQRKGFIDNVGVQEEVDTFMFEGHDTSAAALSFALMSIANDKIIQDKIFLELDEIFGKSDRPTTMDDFSRLNYLECCIKETLRLYPPVHFIARSLGENIQLDKYTLDKGTLCIILIYDMHRRADLFKNPLKFDPERFFPENLMNRHPYSYIPFSAGPRNCIGQKFAMLEMKAALAAVLRKYRLEPVTRHEDIEITGDIILRTSHPIYVKFIKRE